MNSESTTNDDQRSTQDSGSQRAGSSQSSTSTSPKPVRTDSDPSRRDSGERKDESSSRTDKSNPDNKPGMREGEHEDDAGEGHKGPRTDITTASGGDRSKGERANAPGQPQRSVESNPQRPPNKENAPARPAQHNPKAPQPSSPGAKSNDSGKHADGATTRPQTGNTPKT